MEAMYTVHATKKLLVRLKQTAGPPVEPTTVLGNWYANVTRWRPMVAVFVNETTLLPVFLPLAPAATLLERFPEQLGEVLTRLQVPAEFIAAELAEMGTSAAAKTASRSVLGSMNDFVSMADHYRESQDMTPDLLDLSVWLSNTPCSPLDKRHGSPDRELASLVKTHPPRADRR